MYRPAPPSRAGACSYEASDPVDKAFTASGGIGTSTARKHDSLIAIAALSEVTSRMCSRTHWSNVDAAAWSTIAKLKQNPNVWEISFITSLLVFLAAASRATAIAPHSPRQDKHALVRCGRRSRGTGLKEILAKAGQSHIGIFHPTTMATYRLDQDIFILAKP